MNSRSSSEQAMWWELYETRWPPRVLPTTRQKFGSACSRTTTSTATICDLLDLLQWVSSAFRSWLKRIPSVTAPVNWKRNSPVPSWCNRCSSTSPWKGKEIWSRIPYDPSAHPHQERRDTCLNFLTFRPTKTTVIAEGYCKQIDCVVAALRGEQGKVFL